MNLEVQKVYNLTPMQEGMLFHALLNVNPAAYFEQITLEIHGELRVECFEKALNRLIERYEILRTNFIYEGVQRPKQVVFKQKLAQVAYQNFSDLEESPKEQFIEEFKQNDRRQGFDLVKGDLIRVAILQTSAQSSLIIWSFHHILMDGWCLGIIIKDFAIIYQSVISDRPVELPKVSSYSNYIKWLEKWEPEAAKNYWSQYLEGYEQKASIPGKKKASTKNEYQFTKFTFMISESDVKALEGIAGCNQVTLNTITQTIWGILLQKYNNVDDVVFGAVVSGRPAEIEGIEKMVGLFINTIPVRIQSRPEQSFLELIQQIQNAALASEVHSYTSLAEIQADTILKQDLIDNIVVFENYPLEKAIAISNSEAGAGFSIQNITSFEQTNYDFNLIIAPGAELTFKIKYNAAVYEPEMVQKIADHMQEIIRSIIKNPNIPIVKINPLTEKEKQQLLIEFNTTRAEYPGALAPGKTVHQVFEEQVMRTPEAVAVFYEGEQLTYRDLNTKANRLARMIRAKGIKTDDIAGLMVERASVMMIGILGILKAGGAYLPIDPSYPKARITYLLHDSKARLIVTQNHLAEAVPSGTEIITLETLSQSSHDGADLEPLNRAGDLAYVIYTSGSTGNPKGVMIQHQNIVNLITGLSQAIYNRYTGPLKVALIAPYVFDASVKQIFAALCLGHSLYIVPESVRSDGEKLIRYYQRNAIDISDGTPIHLQLIMNSPVQFPETLPVKHFIIGGEALSDQVIRNFYERFQKDRPFVTNVYGPTECCVDATSYLIEPEQLNGLTTIPIGKPLPNVKIYILDRNLELVPPGVPGELYISGAGVARGYMNRPELTAEKFVRAMHNAEFIMHNEEPVKSEHSGISSGINGFNYELGIMNYELMYKTGDLARWLPDGDIEFLGRMDHQVKIRGFRLELGEIEARFLQHPLIKEVVAIVKEDENADKYLCAYYISHGELTVHELRSHLLQTLPEYMIPSHFIPLERLPLTQNGKVDRKAFAERQVFTSSNKTNSHKMVDSSQEFEPDQMSLHAEYCAPQTETEKVLSLIWQKLLRCEQIGTTDNFFELGGHSLKATRMMAMIHQELKVELPLEEIFKTPTIRELAKYIDQANRILHTSIQPAPEREYYPVSAAQKRLYMLVQFDEAQTNYNTPGALQIEGRVDRARLENAFRALINRHEALRTSFELIQGEPVQIIHPTVDFQINYLKSDVTALPMQINGLIKAFDLNKPPLLRVYLIEIATNKHLLMFDMSHIISDGISLSVLGEEFIDLYEGKLLPELRIQYKDYAIWQNDFLRTERIQQQAGYWQEQFAGELPLLDLPTDNPRPKIQSFSGDHYQMGIDRELSGLISRLTAESNSTLFMVLLAAFNVLLAKYSNQEDIIIGVPIAGRPHADLERIVGMFVNTLAFRNYPAGAKSFREFLNEVKEKALKAYENQDYQFEELVEKLNLRRDLSRNPLFDVMFVLQNIDFYSRVITDLRFTPYPMENKVAKFDLTLTAAETEDGIQFNFEYCAKLFKRETIERMAGYWRTILRAITSNPELKLGDIEIMTEAEKREILYDFNDTAADYPKIKTIHQLFEEQVERTPDRVAIVFEDQRICYRELNTRANQLARFLRKKGVKPGSIAGIMAKRSIEMIIGAIGVLKAGAAYLPIDPEYPAERIKYMLEDSQTAILLTQPEFIAAQFGMEQIDLEAPNLAQGEISNLDLVNSTNDLSYIIYTSGTTGSPKGVMIEHRNVVRLLFNSRNRFDFNAEDTWTMFHSFCFDFSVWEMYGALLYGGKLIIIPRPIMRDPKEYLALLKREQVTILNQTPTMFYNLAAEEMKDPTRSLKIRYVIFGGEALQPMMLQPWQEKYPDTKLINMYGITETTVHVTFKELGKHELESNISIIGNPIPTLTVYVMDRNLKITPLGIAGELCVGGEGVGRGYLNRPELTDHKFRSNPYQKEERLYLSGDLARFSASGELEYLGRIDHQVKIRGFRIELGEIEAQLLKHQTVKEAIVIAKEDANGNKYLCAYLTGDQELAVQELREYLANTLPDYMIPSYFVWLARLPLTPNGKIDRKQLPEPEGNSLAEAEYAAPRSKIEATLAEIWREVLGVKQVGLNDNFFHLGGDSIKSIQISARLYKYGFTFKIWDLFQHPTIGKLSGYINTIQQEISQAPVEGEVTLTPIQKWFFSKNLSKWGHFNQSALFYNEHGFEEKLVRQVFTKIVEHHDALRMVYPIDAERIGQYNRGIDGLLFDLQVFDFTHEPEYAALKEKAGAQIEQAANQIQESINLEEGPLVKLGLFKTGAGDHLLIVIHHLVVDGVSWRIILEDLVAGYTQALKGEAIQLPPKTHSYQEWARQLEEYASGEKIQKEASYWREIGRQEIPRLPRDHETAQYQIKYNDQLTMVLGLEDTEKLLKESSRAYNTEINDLLLTALGMTIKNWTQNQRVSINLEGHGREDIIEDVNISRTVGWFTTIYPVVLDMSRSESLSDQIKMVKETLRSIPNKGIGYGILSYLTAKPPFQPDSLKPEICFNYLGQFDQELNTGLFTISKLSAGTNINPEMERNYVLDINGMIAAGKLTLAFTYNRHEFDQGTMARLIEDYRRNLGTIITHCSEKETAEDSEGSRRILKYKVQSNVTTYLHRSLPLGIIDSYVQMLPWLYEHFIKVCSQIGDDGWIALDYEENIDAHRDVIHHVKLGYAALTDVTDIVNYLLERINLKQYVIISLDEYYLREKESYQKNHFVHESLIYGYDSSKKHFIAFGFDKDRFLNQLSFSYDEVFEAFEAGKIHYKGATDYVEFQAVQLLSVIEGEVALEFHLNVFLQEINHYLLGIGEKDRHCVVVWQKVRTDSLPPDRIKYGLNVYDDVIHGLELFIRGDYKMDYRCFHLLAEHKRGIYERLAYIGTRYSVSRDVAQWIEAYQPIVHMMEKIRIKMLEMVVANDPQINVRGVLQEIISEVKLIKQKEEEILTKILEQLTPLLEVSKG